jgi:hypothetical protein
MEAEEIWQNKYETWSEVHAAMESYVRFYNEERIHSALSCSTPTNAEAKASGMSLTAAQSCFSFRGPTVPQVDVIGYY